jgi:hypothetical protein
MLLTVGVDPRSEDVDLDAALDNAVQIGDVEMENC